MSIACLIFAAILPATACPPTRPVIVEQLGEARVLRPDVEKAIEVTNDALRVAHEPFRVVASWQLNGRGLRENEIVIYLIKSPLSPRVLSEERNELQALVTAISADFSGIADATAIDCSDLDDCVEALYPEATVNLVMEVLNRQNSWELAKTSPECRCIVLMEQDLQLYRIVFGADWDRYVLLTRFDSAEELRAALKSGRIPNALLDGESVPLGPMVALLLLHEVGHVAKVPLQISTRENADLTAYLDGLSRDQREELRADSFVAQILAARCFGQNPTGLLLHTCIAPSMLSMLTFVVGVKGKSNDARCLRYFDTVPGYPNWQARLLLLNYQYLPESANNYSLLIKYLSIRQQLLEREGIGESEVCRRAALLSSSN